MPHSTQFPSISSDTDHTEQAPSFAPPSPSGSSSSVRDATELVPGDVLGEFEIIDILGRGGFGVVYLARERSLDRQVALKISPDAGSEGRNLARLEHENIIQVYSETVDTARHQRLLCMQYVAGMTLGDVIALLRERGPEVRSGAGILRLLDEHKQRHARFEPTALRDRELLESSDFVQAVCLLVSRLSEALAHAHRRDILHLDIKPNNILLSQYGRPYLMDFNLSFQSVGMDTTQSQLLGGTLPYMPPEHLEAFLSRSEDSHARLDARTDIYALGVVLFELLEGRLPFQVKPQGDLVATVRAMIAERRDQLHERLNTMESSPEFLNRVVRRCLAPLPEQRFAAATELQSELEGCRQLHQAQRDLPRPRRLLRRILRWPWFWLVLFGLIPHLVGSVVQIAYNATRIVDELSPRQQELFEKLVMGFNPIAYSACLVWLLAYIIPVHRVWRRSVARGRPSTPPEPSEDPLELAREIDVARRDSVCLPSKAAMVGGVGWLSSALFFPTVLHFQAGGLPGDVWLHFWISFLLAGSIAVAYGFILTQYLMLRAVYPEFWLGAADFRQRAAEDLRCVEPLMRIFQTLAAAIPLMGAVIMVSVGPDEFTARDYGAFRALVTLLILSGMFGARLATMISRLTSEMIRSLVGPRQ